MLITSPAQAGTARTRSAAGARVRRVLLLLHLATGLGWLGVTSAFVVLTVWLLDVRDPATVRAGYLVHELLVVWVARPAAIGVAATGLLLTLAAGRRRPPRWWLWWVPAKLALVVATVVVTVSVSPVALRFAVDHAEAVGSVAYTDTQHSLVLMAVYHVFMISAAALLAIFRPGARYRVARRSGVAS
jgi:hypothetical protein